MMRRRRAFALPIVLWLMVAMVVAAAIAGVSAREAIAAASNRAGLARAHWLAEGCANIALAVAEEWLGGPALAATRWSALDSVQSDLSASVDSRCRVELRPAGLTLNVNTAFETGLRRVFEAAGLNGAAATSLAAAIMDWRDGDSEQRPNGAERDWYASVPAPAPRNTPFGASREVTLVRGALDLPGIDTLLGVEPDAVVLTRAAFAVVAGLPGMNAEALAEVLSARSVIPFPDLTVIAERLSGQARTEFQAALPALRHLTTPTAAVWVLTATARAPVERTDASIELRLARDNTRIAIVRRRTWP
jgi:hypothetical protein